MMHNPGNHWRGISWFGIGTLANGAGVMGTFTLASLFLSATDLGYFAVAQAVAIAGIVIAAEGTSSTALRYLSLHRGAGTEPIFLRQHRLAALTCAGIVLVVGAVACSSPRIPTLPGFLVTIQVAAGAFIANGQAVAKAQLRAQLFAGIEGLRAAVMVVGTAILGNVTSGLVPLLIMGAMAQLMGALASWMALRTPEPFPSLNFRAYLDEYTMYGIPVTMFLLVSQSVTYLDRLAVGMLAGPRVVGVYHGMSLILMACFSFILSPVFLHFHSWLMAQSATHGGLRPQEMGLALAWFLLAAVPVLAFSALFAQPLASVVFDLPYGPSGAGPVLAVGLFCYHLSLYAHKPFELAFRIWPLVAWMGGALTVGAGTLLVFRNLDMMAVVLAFSTVHFVYLLLVTIGSKGRWLQDFPWKIAVASLAVVVPATILSRFLLQEFGRSWLPLLIAAAAFTAIVLPGTLALRRLLPY